jgi:hypothetical protein
MDLDLELLATMMNIYRGGKGPTGKDGSSVPHGNLYGPTGVSGIHGTYKSELEILREKLTQERTEKENLQRVLDKLDDNEDIQITILNFIK